MKKILAILTTAAVLSSPALASTEGTYYLKAAVGGHMLNKVTDKDSGLKLKASTGAFIDAGFGYALADNVRTGLDITYLANPELKKSGVSKNYNTNVTVKRKASVVALIPNVFVDLFDVSAFKVFAGVGLGLSQVNDKITESFSQVPSWNGTYKAKKKTNVAYTLNLGAAAEVAQGVSAELTYSWRDFGKAKKSKTLTDLVAYKGHFLSAGVKFDL